MTDAPEAHELPAMVERHQQFRPRRFGSRHDDLIAYEAVRDDGSTQAQRLAAQSGVGVESECRSGLRGRIRDELHLSRARVVAREAHLFPGHELARQFLDALETMAER